MIDPKKSPLNLYFDIPKILGTGCIFGFLVPGIGAEMAGFCFAGLVGWFAITLGLAVIGGGLRSILS